MNRALELGRKIADELNAIEAGEIDPGQLDDLDDLRREFLEQGEKLRTLRTIADDPDQIRDIEETLHSMSIVIGAIDRHVIGYAIRTATKMKEIA